MTAREIEFVPCTDRFLEAFDVFRKQEERGLSFVDAALVAICRARRAEFVGTFDTGFHGIEGLTVVPGL